MLLLIDCMFRSVICIQRRVRRIITNCHYIGGSSPMKEDVLLVALCPNDRDNMVSILERALLVAYCDLVVSA
jgi:hypothetical protein